MKATLLLIMMQVFMALIQSLPSNPLAAYTWQKRVVLIFMPVANHREGNIQVEKMRTEPQKLAERDLVIITIVDNKAQGGEINASAGTSLRKLYKIIPADFKVILIGKDGGEKYRSGKVTHPDILFNLIDAMPMRQREQNNQKSNKSLLD